MSRYIDADAVYELFEPFKDAFDNVNVCSVYSQILNAVANAPTIDAVEAVRCKDCKHRPIKEDADGENYGFNLIEPNDGDRLCPCLVSDGWYSWMPKDDFYCGFGERETDHE